MQLFNLKRSISEDCARQLQVLSEDRTVAELEVIDAKGKLQASGKTQFRHFDAGEGFVYFDLPTRMGHSVPINAGDIARIYVIRSGSVNGFEGVVLERTLLRVEGFGAISVLKFDAPEDLKNCNRRRHFRIVPLASAPVKAEWRVAVYGDQTPSESKRPWVNSRVHDLSGRGIGMYVRNSHAERLEPGRSIELKIEISRPNPPNPIHSRAIVRRIVRHEDETRPVFLGVEFDAPSKDPDHCIEEIMSYVTFCQLEIARLQRERES